MSPPITGTPTTHRPRSLPAGEENSNEILWWKQRLVMRPMRRVSAWATKPAAKATTIDSPEITSTRLSTGRTSGSTSAATSVGASEGATGSAPSRSSLPPLATASLLEKHRRRSRGAAHLTHDLVEAARHLAPQGRRERSHRADQPILRGVGRASGEPLAARGQRQAQLAGVAVG